ncbi:hypothetical protein [Clostridium botulinum]|uniref:hypothetical protein n=1 Tax=Clostridium botulinum TaxID=1491 RepID=UPI0019676572|nr:hypothetical protein [Clostridium botulinum]
MNNKETNIIKAEGKDLIGGKMVIKANNYKKYKATFDYSLVAEELAEDGAEFYEVSDKQFTDDIINVRFKLSTYNKEEYKKLRSECKLNKVKEVNKVKENNKILKKEELKGVKRDDKKTREYLKEKYKNKNRTEISEIRDKYKNIINEYKKTIKSTKEIRQDLYENGFDITFAKTGEIVHYVRFLRSSGSSRVGICLFIKEELHDKIMNWCYMGLNIDEMTETDLASLEAYLSLPASSIIATIKGIKAENILFIKEVKDTFTENAMCTEIENNDNGDCLYTSEKEMEITNSIHDGQALMDASLFNDNGYADKGMLLLRNRFFKGACFNTNIQKWFTDNNITDVSQLNGYTRATNISQIKLILNDTCVKFVKFGSREDWLDKLEDRWGVVKYEKPTHHFKGNLVSTHYQLLNTLNFNRDEMVELLKPTMEYFNLMLNDSRVMRNFIGANVDDIEDLKDNNLMISALVSISDEYSKTKLYTNFRDEKRKSFLKQLQKGHILIKGTYSVLFGNPIEMLKESIGKYTGASIFKKGEVYCTNFKNVELLGCRSPHVTMGNLALMKNVHIKAIDTYFNLSENIICVNSIGENTLERLSSADFDSDSLLLTSSELAIEKLKLHYNKFLVPTSNVQATPVQRLNNSEQKSELDVKTSVNKIGEIINLSQQLNTIIWDKYNRTGELDMAIYTDVCQLDVMSCIEIDSAKKEFSINNVKELDKLREKYKIDSYEEGKTQIKPYFMQFTGKLKEEKKEEQFKKIEFKKYHTSMDYLEDIIENEFKKIRAKKLKSEDVKTIQEIIINNTKDYKVKDANRHQIPEIIKIIEKADKEVKSLYSKKPNKNLSNEEIKEFNIARGKKVMEINNNMYAEISKLKVKIETIKKLFIETESKYSHLSRKIFTVMFMTNKDKVLELLKNTKDDNLTKYVMTRGKSDITILGLGYKEVKCGL